MFIPTPKTKASIKGINKLIAVPPISVGKPEYKKVTKISYIMLKLHSNLTDNSFPEYNFSMQYFRSNATEELGWYKPNHQSNPVWNGTLNPSR